METPIQKQLAPWAGIWIHTRKSIRHIIDTTPKRGIIYLALANGIVSGLYWVETLLGFYPKAPPSLLYLICILGGAFVGVIQLYVVSWLYLFCGRWIGGKGTYTEVKCAVGWSFYPFIISGIFGLFGGLSMSNMFLQTILGLIGLIAFVWGIIILFKVIAEAHRFASAWRGLACVIIGSLLVLGCFFIFSFIEALIL